MLDMGILVPKVKHFYLIVIVTLLSFTQQQNFAGDFKTYKCPDHVSMF